MDHPVLRGVGILLVAWHLTAMTEYLWQRWRGALPSDAAQH